MDPKPFEHLHLTLFTLLAGGKPTPTRLAPASGFFSSLFIFLMMHHNICFPQLPSENRALGRQDLVHLFSFLVFSLSHLWIQQVASTVGA